MSYHLIIGDYAYSSWSLRGWLLFENFGIARRETLVNFNDASGVAAQLADAFPSKTVPTLVTEDGVAISDSLAIAEELASRHPDAGLWPSDAKHRAVARTLAAEMHSGFSALRGDCPMNLRTAYADSSPRQEVLADINRLETIWQWARDTCVVSDETPWLCGQYCAADAFFAPVAARLAGYSLPINTLAQSYVSAHLSDPAFQKWRALGLEHGDTLEWYKKSCPVKDWPSA